MSLNRILKGIFCSPTIKLVGYIIEIDKLTFRANLRERNSDNPGTDEIREFNKSEVRKKDKQLLAIGAVFEWKIWGGSFPFSRLEFARPKKVCKKEVKKIEEWAKRLYEGLNFDNTSQ